MRRLLQRVAPWFGFVSALILLVGCSSRVESASAPIKPPPRVNSAPGVAPPITATTTTRMVPGG